MNSNAVAEKEYVRAQLLQLVNTELRQRPVSQDDVDAFRRFDVPSLLHNAIGRSLGDAEARAISAMLTMSPKKNSVPTASYLQPDGNSCDCHGHQCPECAATQFRDYGFGPLYSNYTDVQRSGKLSQIPHSIFVPQPGRSQQPY